MPETTNDSSELNNPHDKFFKGAVGMIAVARPMLEKFLPCFNYILINLQDYSEAQIRSINDILLQKTLLGFKFIKTKTI